MIEPLESRIAPAALHLIAFNFTDSASNKTQSLQFVNAANPGTNPANIAIAKTVGDASNVYFIKVSAGEDLQVYTTQTGAADLINVSQGTVVAFFTDTNPNNSATDTVLASELSGLAVGNKVSAVISSGVNGDVVTNYNDSTGMLGGTFAIRGHPAVPETAGDATMLLPNYVTSLTIAGPITGDFIAGGPVKFLQVTGTIHQVLTGDAAMGYTFSFDPLVTNTTGDTTLNVPIPAAGVAGPSISAMLLDSAALIQLGSGGAGAAGGSISNLTLLNDLTGIDIQAGAGGAGIVGKTAGGPGGTISNVIVNGPLAGSPPLNANSLIEFQGGAGGNGLGSAGGGAGGGVSNIHLDYTLSGGVYSPASNYLPDNVTIQGGAGGTGGIAGAGGSLTNINVLVATPHDTAAPTAAEIQLLGGIGGSTTVGGRGGAGGSITTVNLYNYALPVIDPSTGFADDTSATSPTLTVALIQAGAGGTAAVKGPGGAGGSITGMTLEGYNFSVLAGAGGQGVSAGGAGGHISTVDVLGSAGALPGDNFHAESLFVLTGAGGNATAGPGGAGGYLKTLTVQNADFGVSSFVANTGLLTSTGVDINTGAGGNAAKGAAGAGGSITGVQVTEVDFQTDTYPLGLAGTVSITAGNGGSAPVAGGKGGAGGSITTAVFVGEKVDVSTVTAGSGGVGGAAGLAGRGGAGGSITAVAIRNAENALPSTTTASYGILEDTTADFVGDAVAVGDPIENTTTGASTTVIGIIPTGTSGPNNTSTELVLASDIFAAGDQYLLPNEGASGTAQDSGLVLTDTNATFQTDNVMVGDTITDTKTGLSTTVTAIDSQTELTLAKNIFTAGDPYKLPAENATGIAMGPGILNDSNAAFATNNVMPGNTITDTTNGLSTTVVSVVSQTQLVLAQNIFATGDKYSIPAETITGTDMLSPNLNQDTIIDTSANFKAEGVVVGDTVEDISNLDLNTSATPPTVPEPVYATITAISGDTLTLLADSATPGDISHVGDQYTVTNVASSLGQVNFIGGNGGAGFTSGAGGVGGGISGSSAKVPGSVSFTGGTGGNGGALAAAGAGGSLVHDGALSTNGSGSLIAGSAGATGAKPGAGGSVTTADIQAPVNVTLMAGNGFAGGAGGSISSSGYQGAPVTDANPVISAPSGNITVQAGNGGTSLTGAGGAGGSILGLKGGFISLGDGIDPFTTQFVAGSGGNGVTAGGAGGSVNTLVLHGGGGADVTMFIDAGDAGNASAGRIGATGGSVLNVAAGGEASSSGEASFSINPLTDFHHVSAGNGGDATLKGGLGGSVSDVFTNAAIGVRTGAMFGFNLAGAGGISAGAGGTGATTGLAGNVTNITADAISSIVAGHINTGQGLEQGNLANKVDNIKLNGTVAPSLIQQFDLTFNGQTTVSLPTNATPLQVASALNALQNIATAGGVSVTEGSNGYIITFNTPGAGYGTANTITAQEPSPALASEVTVGNAANSVPEVQSVQVIAADTFTLSFDGNTTTPLTVTGNAANDAMAVQNALNQLPGLNTPTTNVSVTAVEGTATTNPVFTVTFSSTAGPEPLIVPNMVFGANPPTGTSMSIDVQTITYPIRGDLVPSQLATANFVGSIYNPIRFNATVFDYSNFPAAFQFGDVPIDGLIAATNLTGNKNFVPEAYVTVSGGNAVLVDNTLS